MYGFSIKKVSLFCLALISSLSVYSVADSSAVSNRIDTFKTQRVSEFSDIYKFKRVSSSFPVEIVTKGLSLLVTSKHSQVLPVYKSNGVFYGLFRLNKGVNWISGLPKGTYIINNIKFELS